MDPTCELSQVGDRFCELLGREIERRREFGRRLVVDDSARHPQLECETDEALLRTVVEIAFEPRAFGGRYGEDPSAGGPHFCQLIADSSGQSIVVADQADRRSHRACEPIVVEEDGVVTQQPDHLLIGTVQHGHDLVTIRLHFVAVFIRRFRPRERLGAVDSPPQFQPGIVERRPEYRLDLIARHFDQAVSSITRPRTGIDMFEVRPPIGQLMITSARLLLVRNRQASIGWIRRAHRRLQRRAHS